MRINCECGSGLPVYTSFAHPYCKECQLRILGNPCKVRHPSADAPVGLSYGQRIAQAKVMATPGQAGN